jgi:hypothetical protein
MRCRLTLNASINLPTTPTIKAGSAILQRTRGAAQRLRELFVQLMNWYVRTSDVAAKQFDPRGFPA